MAELIFRCPTSGDDVESGIETDSDTRSQIRLFRLRILCPACGQTHDFGTGEARPLKPERTEVGHCDEPSDPIRAHSHALGADV
jgi:hypothetical protein